MTPKEETAVLEIGHRIQNIIDQLEEISVLPFEATLIKDRGLILSNDAKIRQETYRASNHPVIW